MDDRQKLSSQKVSKLFSFSMELSKLGYEELYPFILQFAMKAFNLNSAIYAGFEDESKSLKTNTSGLSANHCFYAGKQKDLKISFPDLIVSDDQYQKLLDEPYLSFNSYEDLFQFFNTETSANAFSETNHIILTGLVFNGNLTGAIIMSVSGNYGQPETEELSLFSRISSNGVSRILAEKKQSEAEAAFKKLFKNDLHYSEFINSNGRILNLNESFNDTKHPENHIKEREEVFEAIANYTANWESWFDISGRIIWTNPASFRFTGYTPDEIMGLPDYLTTLVAEYDRERVSGVLNDALSGKDQSDVEFTCIRKDKSTFRINVSWNHIYDKNGKALGIRSSGQDVTSHRLAEEAFSKTEGLYKQMIENAPFGMHFYELNEKEQLIFTGANQAANKILGIDHQPLIGLTIEEVFPSLISTNVINHYRISASENITWETDQIIYADDRISGAFEVKSFQTMPGKMVTMFTDITKRKQAEKDLNESRQLFEALTRVSPVGIFRTDESGETTYVNPMWTLLTGLSYQDALESKYLMALHPDDRDERVAEWRETVKGGKTITSEYRFLRPDGTIVWVQGRAVPEIVDNKIRGYIGTITDITELKKAEEEILKAKEKAEASNRLKTTFMGNISHEIRTPLNGIIGFAELISSGDNTPEENEECKDFLNQSINRLTKIIDNIMDVSMMMSGNTTVKEDTFTIKNLMHELYLNFEPKASKKNLIIEINDTSETRSKPITSDKSLINRILTELIDNAVKFTNKGRITVQYEISGNKLYLTVRDTGAGISYEYLPFIFEPFVQEDVYSARAHNSNGLGLAIVREATGILGGEVSAESTPGSGTTIKVIIPVSLSEVTEPVSEIQDNDETRVPQPVIMVVEDEEINMIYLKRLLSQKGYQLLFASGARDAISLVTQNANIDLILMDMKMPGMDGFEATRKIKEIAPAIKIAAVTAYASESDRESCVEAGCDEYIAKPFNKNDLFNLLSRMKF